MNNQKLNDLADVLEHNINDYINSIDCCSICEEKKSKERYEEICTSCCFFYPSHFKIKK